MGDFLRRRTLLKEQTGGGDNVNYVTALIGDGSSWVSTEIVQTAATSYHVVFSKTWNAVKILFGCGNNQFVFLSNSSLRLDFGGKMQTVSNFQYGTTHDIYISPTAITIDDASVTPQWTGFGPIDNYITLFGKNNGRVPNYNVETGTIANATVYDFIVAENGVEVSHLRPALDPNGVPCMYDTVRKVYQYNRGSGTFDYIP